MMSPWLFVWLYVLLLAGHFVYALSLLKSGRVDLALGPIRSRRAILTALLLINAFSLTAFVYPKGAWVLFHIAYHVFLAADEIYRMTKVRQRWPFFVNHLLFAWCLYLFYGTLTET